MLTLKLAKKALWYVTQYSAINVYFIFSKTLAQGVKLKICWKLLSGLLVNTVIQICAKKTHLNSHNTCDVAIYAVHRHKLFIGKKACITPTETVTVHPITVCTALLGSHWHHLNLSEDNTEENRFIFEQCKYLNVFSK